MVYCGRVESLVEVDRCICKFAGCPYLRGKESKAVDLEERQVPTVDGEIKWMMVVISCRQV